MGAISKTTEEKLIKLFSLGKTVQEISEATGIEKRDILLHLTKRGLWSTYCSDCVLKQCFDCRGLSELGKPISVQDEIDLIATMKRKNKT